MFDLRSALRSWHLEMTSHEAVGVEDLAELESHLLEEFDALCAGGHEAAEAFELAVHRLGSCGSLHAEFAKRDPRGLERERALWAVLGILAWMTLWHAWNLVAGKASVFLAAALPEGWRGESWLYGEGCLSEGYAIALALLQLTVLCLVLRSLESPRSIRWLFLLRRVTQHPVRFALLGFAAIVVLSGVTVLLNVGLTRMYAPEVFGRAALLSQFTFWVLAFLQPLLVGSFLLRWRNAIRTDEDRGHAGDERISRVPAPVFWMLLGGIGYSILSSVLSIVQVLLNGSWLGLRPDSWPLKSWLYDDRYRFSELETVLLVLLPLTVLLLLMRTLSPEWIRGRLHGALNLMLRRRRFWPVYLILCWLPPICLHGIRSLAGLWMGPGSERFVSFALVTGATHLFLALAWLVGILVTFLLLVKRRPPVAGGEVECT